MKNIKFYIGVLAIVSLAFIACEKDDSGSTEPQTQNNSNGGGNMNDTTQTPVGDQFWLGNGSVKCTPFTKTLNATINLLSVNTEKCYGESVRPNFTFDFPNGANLRTGTYYVINQSGGGAMTDSSVSFYMSGYNNLQYNGVSGEVNVSVNSSDASKLDFTWDKINIYSPDDSMNYIFTGRIDSL